MPLPTQIPQDHATITLDPYIVAGFMPRTYPYAGALGKSACSIGTSSTSSARAAQLAVDMGCYTRWIADPTKLVDHGDGTFRWNPSQGSDLTPYWKFDAASMPVVDSTYDWKLRNGDIVSFPAFLFPGSIWGTLVGFPDHLAGYTLLMVARLRGTNGAAYANIVASTTYSTDPDHSADVYMRWRNHRIYTHKRGYQTFDDITPTGRPQIVGCRMSEYLGAQIVGDNNWSYKRFNHDQVNAYDMNWFLARGSDSYSDPYTLRADILDICMWNVARSDADLRRCAHMLNGIYGVVRA